MLSETKVSLDFKQHYGKKKTFARKDIFTKIGSNCQETRSQLTFIMELKEAE